MKKWQKLWLYACFIFFTYHILRDIMQDMHIYNRLSTILVKQDLSNTPWWYWKVFNTYVIGVVEVFIAGACILKKRFGRFGYMSIFIAFSFFGIWLNYWFFL